jgi:hypothetical protein
MICLSQETYCAVCADTPTTILAIYISTQVSSFCSSIITAAGGMSVTLTWFTLCSIRWSTSTPWKLIVQRTTVVTVGATSIMLAFTLWPLQFRKMRMKFLIQQIMTVVCTLIWLARHTVTMKDVNAKFIITQSCIYN